MNGEKGSIEINIPVFNNNKESEKKTISYDVVIACKGFILGVWQFCKEDSNRVIFALKVGLAVLIVSLLILCRTPYEVFGTNIIWSILTVAVMFEYTVGATFNRGLNRALGSILAGILAISIGQLALSAGRVAEPVIIGFSIFIVGAVTSFMKLWPSLMPYEYGFRVVLFTYCLIIVSGYRMGNPIRTAMDRLYSIAIGGIVAVLVNILVFPIWAGEQLHKELVSNFTLVADALEECIRKYLEDGLEHAEFTKTVMDEFSDEPAYRKCRSTMNSPAKLESLALSAIWEPPHGRFRHFLYPWSEYVKVGAALRYCAYEVMALHGVLHSEIQAPYNLRITFGKEIQDTTTNAAELLRYMGKDIHNMQQNLKTFLLKRVHSSTEKLQHAIDMQSYLLIAPCKPSDSFSRQQSNLPETLPTFSSLSNHNDHIFHPLESAPPVQGQSFHEMMRKQSRRMFFGPSREVHTLEESGSSTDVIPRMLALESTATLSLAAFTSLLIEFVARLDHLVEAVDKLSRMAKFKQEVL